MAGQGEDEGRLPASARPGRRRGVTTGGRVAMVRGLPVPRGPDPPMAGPDSPAAQIAPGGATSVGFMRSGVGCALRAAMDSLKGRS